MAKFPVVNYFEFYGLPVSFQLDEQELKRKYYSLSRDFHPDFHTLADAGQQASALEKSTLNNQAFKTLSDFESRLKYILDHFGKLKSEGENQVPQDFLLEMMDINESLMELEMDPTEAGRRDLIETLGQIEKENLTEIAEILKKEVNSLTEGEWSALSAYYLKNQYLKRLHENIDKLTAEE